MKKYNIQQIERTEKVLEEIQCDMCKQKFKSEFKFDWLDLDINTNEFKCEFEKWNSYPEWNCTDILFFEICSNCREEFFRRIAEMWIDVYKKDWEDYDWENIELWDWKF